jgi:hypothetical protein
MFYRFARKRFKTASLAAICVLCAFPVAANAQTAETGRPDENDSSAAAPTNPASICQMVQSAAAGNGLPFEFFARVIWQESRFRSDAVGPTTRNGQRAQGIAQFMPMTAAERLLHNPFDPVQALPKSAEFLRDLRAQFGNLGLAAAAYNAGPQRVRDWLAGKRTIPSETQAYVRNVTGRSVEEWAKSGQHVLMITIPKEMTCAETANVVAKPQSPSQSPTTIIQPKPAAAWGVQLVGDRSEIKALAVYRQLQRKHQTILGNYEPVVLRTTLRVTAAPIWCRVRVDANSREVAEMLCLRLRAAGESCLVQRN